MERIQNKTKHIILFAYNFKKINHNKIANDILCPGCNNPAIINVINDEMNEANIMNCKNNHINFDIPFKEFAEKKNNNYNLEKCDKCGNYENLYGISLDICSCEKKICPLCKLIHDPNHYSINFSERFKFCSKHTLPFITYCHKCNINICEKCEEKHIKHKLSYFKDIVQSEKMIAKIIENSKDIKNLCELVKDEINRTQMIFNKVINYFMKNLEGYSILNSNILEFVKDMKNYETIENINNIFKFNQRYKKVLENNILKTSFNERIQYLLKFYNEKSKHLTIYYKNPKETNSFRIFNKDFVLNNKNNCRLKIRNKDKNLRELYKFKNKYYESDLSQLKVKLIGLKKLNLYKMFQNCENLLSFDKDEFFFVEDSDRIANCFFGCENLKILPDLSMLNVSNIQDFTNIFYKCSSLTSLPDISKWRTNQAILFNGMFKNCNKLIKIPDISKWETSIINFVKLFSLFL